LDRFDERVHVCLMASPRSAAAGLVLAKGGSWASPRPDTPLAVAGMTG
jgi:hypothetical protein